MISNARKRFITALGNTYALYGYPNLLGWINAILLLEPGRKWAQAEISQKLSAIFIENDHPTSLASVNRALKVLEQYGAVEKSGSRKLGYSYRLAPSSKLLDSMFHQFIAATHAGIEELAQLKLEENLDDDPALQRAIESEIEEGRVWIQILEKMLELIAKEPVG
ncbi:MAG: hypothetical protein ACXADX_21130 [Candidatus Hodarchaeales archaeon]|jgi:DNA-binding transcriptional regulator GbsR (MarR family)